MSASAKTSGDGFLASVAKIVGWLSLARLDRQASLIRSLVVTVAVTLVGLTLSAARLQTPPDAATQDQHALISLDLAIDWVQCGKYATHSATYDLSHYLLSHGAETRLLPVPDILEQVAGSREKYCAAVTVPFLNNENSLFYILSALLWIHPDMTLAGLGVLLIWIRVAGIVFFVFALLCVGASPLFALLTLMMGVEISGLSAATHPYSAYPFLLPFLGIYAGLLALTLHFGFHRTKWYLGPAAVAIGLFGAFFYNLRTTYLPIVVVCYLMFAVVVFVEAGRGRASRASARWKPLGIALAGFAVGAGMFYVAFTYPLTRSGATFNYSYHVVAHPLVLSLALPPSELSKREGIAWSDPVGLELAHRVDPNASYLGPTYERALLTYYSRLWRHYPREMLETYVAKWRLSTTGGTRFVDANMSSLAKRLWAPTRYVESGISFTILLLLLTIAAMYLGIRYSPGAGILVATLVGAGFCVTLEAAIIMPFFYLQYHNAQLLVLFLTNLMLFQIVVNGSSWLFTGNAYVRDRASISGTWAERTVAAGSSDPTTQQPLQDRESQRLRQVARNR